MALHYNDSYGNSNFMDISHISNAYLHTDIYLCILLYHGDGTSKSQAWAVMFLEITQFHNFV